MIVCPWCGTNYLTFQPNCQNCGGLLPMEATAASLSSDELATPPPAPRPIPTSYAWRLLATDGGAVAGAILGLSGIIFSVLGLALTLAISTAFVGISSFLLGIVFLGIGAVLFLGRYQDAQKTVLVLREGEAGCGQITELRENPSVRINGRYPWVLEYQYPVNGQTYAGKITTLNRPGHQLQVGRAVSVLYLAAEPNRSSIFPHP
jgi:hypothetical protein